MNAFAIQGQAAELEPPESAKLNSRVLVLVANPRGADDKCKGEDNYRKYLVAEPGTLAMTVAGLGLGMGLVLFGLRRNRKSVTA